MGEEYEIKLLPNSKPFAIFTPRNVPLATTLFENVRRARTDGSPEGHIQSGGTYSMVCRDGRHTKEIRSVCICVDLKSWPRTASWQRQKYLPMQAPMA